MNYYKIREQRLEQIYKHDRIKKEIQDGTQKKTNPTK